MQPLPNFGRPFPFPRLGHEPYVPPSNVMLLSVGGQSNARKAGNSGGTADAKYLGAMGETFIWSEAAGAFVDYVVGTTSGHRGGLDSGVWGSEAEFIYRLRQEGFSDAIYIVKEAVNGNSLAQAGGGDWYPDTSGERYDGYVTQALAAKAAMATAGVTDFVEVFLWNQGEADSNVPASADAYATNLAYLLSSLAGEGAFGSEGIFVIERIRPCSSDLETATYSQQFLVRQRMEESAASSAWIRIISLDFDAANFNSLHPVEPWTENIGARCHAAYRGTYDATWRGCRPGA